MSGRPWDCDRPLDGGIVRAVVEAQFPALRPVACRPLGSGWDHDAWLVNGAWVFRFPRRADVVGPSLRERALLPVVAEALELPVPRPVLFGEPCARFPYPFAAHRLLEGVPADATAVGPADEPGIARALGRALAQLHDIPPERLAAAELPVEGCRIDDWSGRIAAEADAFRRVMPADAVARWEPWLRGGVAPPSPAPGPFVPGHNDLGAEHVLLDPASRRVAAILDWGDAAWIDPAVDMAALRAWRGEAFLEAMLAAYDRPVDPGLRERARFLSCGIAVTLVAEAVLAGDEAGLARWRRFFLEVFEPRELRSPSWLG